MYLIKLICLTLYQLANQAWLLPQTAATSIKQWRRQIALAQTEEERLDRIRHPSKYVGKRPKI